jgi:hypothetical protein
MVKTSFQGCLLALVIFSVFSCGNALAAAENVGARIQGPSLLEGSAAGRCGSLGCSVGLGKNRGGGNWPMLGRGEQDGGSFWGGLVLGTFVPNGAPAVAPTPKQEMVNWVERRFHYDYPGGKLDVTASYCSPFILFDTDAKGFRLFGEMQQAHNAFQYDNPAVKQMEYLAFAGADGKIEIHKAGADVVFDNFVVLAP